MAHEKFCNCQECRQVFFKKYNTNYMYVPSKWVCRNKQTDEKVVVVARLAKEARDIASQQFNIATTEVTASIQRRG